jgi:hypothetical protein
VGKKDLNSSSSLALCAQGNKENIVVQNDTVLFFFFEEKEMNFGITQKWIMTGSILSTILKGPIYLEVSFPFIPNRMMPF